MSKGLCNMTDKDRKEAVQRRLNSNTKGLGYCAAVDAKVKQDKAEKK